MIMQEKVDAAIKGKLLPKLPDMPIRQR